MKTPEEIKNGLAHCAADDCDDCPYQPDCMVGTDTLEADALAYINDLETAHRKGDSRYREERERETQRLYHSQGVSSDIDSPTKNDMGCVRR